MLIEFSVKNYRSFRDDIRPHLRYRRSVGIAAVGITCGGGALNRSEPLQTFL